MTLSNKYFLSLIILLITQFAFSQHQLEFTTISQVELKSELSMKKALGIHPQNILLQQYNHTDGLNINHKRYKQTIAGYPVEGAVIATHQYTDGKTTANGLWLTDMNPNIPASTLPESNILDIIREVFPPDRKLSWEVKDINEEYRVDISKVWFDENYSKDGKDYLLSYKVKTYISNPFESYTLFIDALTGMILSKYCTHHTANVPAVAEGLYTMGPIQMTVDSISENEYKMIKYNDEGEAIIRTRDVLNNFKIVESTDNEWLDKPAVDCHWGTEKTLGYLKTEIEREGMDGEGSAITVNVHAQDPMGGGPVGNAFYVNGSINIGDGNASSPIKVPLSSLDIIAHEIFHGVTESTANLIYNGESGAINESMSDIFGVTVVEHTTGDYTWDIGAQLNSALRRMDDPKSLEMPAFYDGEFWTGSADVHYNSSIGNLWYYYLVEGGSGVTENGEKFSIEGIGFEKAATIAYRTLSEYLIESSDYEDYCNLSLQAAQDLYGACSPELVSASLAWSAVGLGEVIRGTDLKISKLENLKSDCGLESEELISVELAFESCGDMLTEGTQLTFAYSINGGNPITELYILPENIAPDESFIYTYKQTADLSNVGSYDIRTWVDYLPDAFPINDTLHIKVENRIIQNEDIRLVDILHPNQSTACGLTSIDPIVQLQFLGCDLLSSGSVINVKATLDNSVIESEFVLANELEYEDIIQLTLQGALQIDDYGVHQLSIEIFYPDDPNSANNIIESYIEFFESEENPFIYPFDDESELSSLRIRLGPAVDQDTLIDRFDDDSQSQALMFTGSDVVDLNTNELYIDLVESEDEIWSKNTSHETRTCMCIDATEWDEASLSFDLYIHQVVGLWNSLGIRDPWAANMRVLVDGSPVTETYSYNTQRKFDNHIVDLTDYVGTSFEVCFQSKSLMGRNLYGLILNGDDALGDQVMIDNINVSDELILSNNYEEIDHSSISYYPNPTHDEINVSLSSNYNDDIYFEVINALGKVIKRYEYRVTAGENSLSIPLGELSQGIYILTNRSLKNKIRTATKVIVN